MDEFQIGETAVASDGKLYRFKGGDPKDRNNWEPADAPEGHRPGVVEGTLRGAAQGATFGFSDEAIAGLRGLMAMVPGGRSPGSVVREVKASEREKGKQFREDHPVLSFGTELAGGLATGGAVGTAAKKSGLAGGRVAANSLRRLLAEGAIGGAAAGAGTAEGDLSDRARGAVVGGAAGAAFAGTLKGLGGVAGRVGGRVLDATGLRPKNAETLAGRTVGRVIENADDRASRKTLQALERDALVDPDTPADLSRVRGRLAEAGDKPVTLTDLADPEGNTAGLLRSAKSLPGPAKREIAAGFRDRSRGELDRLTGDLEKHSSITPEWVGSQADEIVAQRKALSGPLYAKLEGQYIKDPDETFTHIFQDPEFAEAYKDAALLARREGYKVPELYDAAGNFRGNQTIPVRVFDYVNRALRDRTRPTMGIGPARAASTDKLRRDLLGHVDELVPEFKEARGVFAGQSDLLDALNQGAEEFTRPKVRPEAVKAALAAMTEGEKEMYRKGAIDALRSSLGDVADDASQSHRLLRTPNIRAKIMTLFDDPAEADAFMKAAGIEERMGQTNASARLLNTSKTPEIQAEQADALEVPRFPTSLRELSGLVVNKALDPIARRAQGFSQDVSAGLAKRLTAGLKNRGDLEKTIQLLQMYAEQQARKQAAGSPVLRAGARVVGGRAGESGRSLR